MRSYFFKKELATRQNLAFCSPPVSAVKSCHRLVAIVPLLYTTNDG